MKPRGLVGAFKVGALALSVAPLALVGAFASVYLVGVLKASAEHAFAETAAFAALHVSDLLTVPSRLVSVAAERFCGEGLPAPRESLETYLSALTEGYPAFARFEVFGPDATIETTYPFDPDRVGDSVTGHSFYDRAASGESVWSSVFLDPPTGKPMVAVASSDGGRGLVGYVSLAALGRLVSEPLASEGASVAVVDAVGIYIAHVDSERVARRESARLVEAIAGAKVGSITVSPYAEGGRRYLCAALKEPSSGWTVAMFLDESELYRPVRFFALAWGAVMAAAAVASLLFSRWMSALFTRPFLELSSLAEGIGEGVSLSPAFSSAFSEVNDVARALLSTSERVAERERDLRASVRERDALVREIHHRVKNNLTVLLGLVGISEEEAPEDARASFEGLKGRVRAMATVHELSYARGIYADVELRPFLLTILEAVLGESSMIDWRLECGDYTLPVDKATPLGLAANELLVNAVKHAFIGRSGSLEVRVSADGPTMALSVTDDGVGYSPRSDAPERSGSGLALVEALASQLRGCFSIGLGARGGTVATLTYPRA